MARERRKVWTTLGREEERKREGLKRKLKVAVVLATGAGLRNKGIDMLWKGALTLTLMYGAEALPVPKGWLKKIEMVKSEMGIKNTTSYEGHGKSWD